MPSRSGGYTASGTCLDAWAYRASRANVIPPTRPRSTTGSIHFTLNFTDRATQATHGGNRLVSNAALRGDLPLAALRLRVLKGAVCAERTHQAKAPRQRPYRYPQAGHIRHTTVQLYSCSLHAKDIARNSGFVVGAQTLGVSITHT